MKDKAAGNTPTNKNEANLNHEEKLTSIKLKLPNINENKLKSLEARFLGPSSNGNLPYEFDLIPDLNYEFMKSSKNFNKILGCSNKSDNNTNTNNEIVNDKEKDFNLNSGNKNLKNFENFINDSDKSKSKSSININENNLNLNLNLDSNENFNFLYNDNDNGNLNKNSARKKAESKKADKRNKLISKGNVDFLSTKRNRNNNNNNNNNYNSNNSNSNCDYDIGKIKSKIIFFFNLILKENPKQDNLINSPLSNNKLLYITKDTNCNSNKNDSSKSQQKKFFEKRNHKLNNLKDNLTLKEHSINNNNNKNNTNLNNINNLNNVINIQNANFINTIQDLSFNSDLPEENIEFTSKNVMSSANLFSKNSKNSDNSNYSNKINKNQSQNQTLLDQFSLKNNSNNNSNSFNNKKINSYFNKTNNSFGNNTNNEDKNTKILKQNYLKLVEDNEKLIKELSQKNKLLTDKEKENEKLKLIFLENEESIKNVKNTNKNYEDQLHIGRKSMIKYLKLNEELKRNQIKIWLNEEGFRLGKFSIQRASTRLLEVWEDGEDIINVKNLLKEIKLNKEDLEKFKKRINIAIKKRESKDKDKDKDNFNSNFNNNLPIGISTTTSGNNNIFQHPNNIYHSNNMININITNSSGNLEDYSEHELFELRELINFKLNKLTKDENDNSEKLEKLEIEKIKYQLEYKRFMEEEKCRYGLNSKEKWPILSNRYLILSLLGRGGYSEAYDLENHIEVACKIHQLNSNWSDSVKENYIRHTIRENQIHKEINHAKVVKHFDTIEIDNNSFCTVLELCSGPDLYTYLKVNKTLIEKDARIIISQILSGVEYLNRLQKKIIHYDLKPQNIIFNNMEVKISDFGLAKIMEDNSDKIELTSQGVGTYWYLPPECFDTDNNPPGISSKVDVWSIGVILYELVFGIRPFGHSLTQDRILKENVITNAKKVEFPNKPIVSEECKDFIKKCLSHNQDDRLDVFEALESGFIKGICLKKNKN